MAGLARGLLRFILRPGLAGAAVGEGGIVPQPTTGADFNNSNNSGFIAALGV